ncbi:MULTISPECIES: dihydrolipoyl dehydrogenase [Thermoactinomyces]|jgi:dihydrolipoamide dehydrogenase|uniref:Dihydrolipoyl dehydrogenase n=1 Tax=Thermoactinomyces vulgaris TaxID=2026 RepID=A0ABS0QKC1_THEVU|nr:MULTISPECIES: dihydrolipoyl dehydrogenase [Thermoactinomyces]KFZ41460.1 dihydrolipoamide dehydrogenase [Thermoactinomyces sp. Gus2-1]MBA4551972.1 dihydrolipoyl dehydrogenase [Thermoactinomyces vulgaris]MBA4596748.1 dihydrolipoyl dehydrogenase [Thermoactinomyces vulgaris]MBH8583292.1 dihydrolipoyl dehydrogenase [Thermoactinomyces sp. CICC 10735]MBH8586537.1 dihydrolipoyl dehydrogenase [Thermoactinomyces sp. CICC 10520]
MVVGDLAQEVDVLVIGAGPGGYVAAIRAAQLGRKVTIVDKDALGGVCLNRGCIPSKALITASERFLSIKEADQMGIEVSGDVNVNMPELMKWKDGVVKKLTGGVKSLLQGNKVEIISGEAYFNGTDSVRVVTDDSSQTYKFNDVIIATGSRPAELPILRFDGKRILSSTEALQLQEVPGRLVVVGGGYIGLELGTAYAKLGAEVTILEGAKSILPGSDPALTKMVMRRLKQLGVNVMTEAMVQGGENKGEEVEIKATVGGEEKTFTADYCLVAVGRKPNTDELGLEYAQVELDERGFIKIDNQCRTNVDHIYAIGDCAGGALLAHKASYEGKVAAEAIAGMNSVIDYQAMPFVVFSDPEIAYTGLTEEEAKEQGYDPVVSRFAFQANGRALSMNQADGFVKIVADSETKQVLGVQIVGPEASTLIGEAVFAVEMGANAEDLSLTIHAHPTLTETIMEAAEGVLGHAIHMVNR